jgi:hypothetical protein
VHSLKAKIESQLPPKMRENAANNEFGILEMGGASSQITFPCPECDITDDTVKAVMLAVMKLSKYTAIHFWA